MIDKSSYKQRWLADRMREAVEFSPVIVLSGARQTGKSTLLRNESPFREWHYVSFDDLDILALASKRPDEILNISKNIVVDEAQSVSGLYACGKKGSGQRQIEEDNLIRFSKYASYETPLRKSCWKGGIFQLNAFFTGGTT